MVKNKVQSVRRIMQHDNCIVMFNLLIFSRCYLILLSLSCAGRAISHQNVDIDKTRLRATKCTCTVSQQNYKNFIVYLSIYKTHYCRNNAWHIHYTVCTCYETKFAKCESQIDYKFSNKASILQKPQFYR